MLRAFSWPNLYRAPLLPPESQEALPAWRSSVDDPDPQAFVKLFLPGTHWTWYIVEYDGTDVCFGLAINRHEEAGNYFSLSRLAKATSTFGDWVERDETFKPTPLSVLRRLHDIQPISIQPTPEP